MDNKKGGLEFSANPPDGTIYLFSLNEGQIGLFNDACQCLSRYLIREGFVISRKGN